MINKKRISKSALIKLVEKYGAVQLCVYCRMDSNSENLDRFRILRSNGKCTWTSAFGREAYKLDNLRNLVSCFAKNTASLLETLANMYHYDRGNFIGEVWSTDGLTRYFPTYGEFTRDGRKVK